MSPRLSRVCGLVCSGLLSACGSSTADGHATETGAASAESSSTSSGGPSSTSGEPTDDERCLAWCLTGNAQGCEPPLAGEVCYTRCKSELATAIEAGCHDQAVAVVDCESEAVARDAPSCAAEECRPVYEELEACTGTCARLFFGDGAGEDQGSRCEWRTTCQDHEVRATCSLDDPYCDCLLVHETIAICPARDLEPSDCSKIPAEVVSCCADLLESVEGM